MGMDALDKPLDGVQETAFTYLLQRVVDEAVHPVGVPVSAFDSSL